MNIVTHLDSNINFIKDCIHCIKNCKTKFIIDTNIEGLTLHIGERVSWSGTVLSYHIVLMMGKKSIAAIQLNKNHDFPEKNNVYEPHSYTRPAFRGRGFVEGIYRWIMDNGMVLKSCGEQTQASQGLWQKLGKTYKLEIFNNQTQRFCSRVSMYQSNMVTVLNYH